MALFGGLPPDAHRLQDFECNRHDASWIRRVLGKGIAGNYVIGYMRGDEWWTFCFDRQVTSVDGDDADEVWLIEAYDSAGNSWNGLFNYVLEAGRWYRPHASSVRTKNEKGAAAAAQNVTATERPVPVRSN